MTGKKVSALLAWTAAANPPSGPEPPAGEAAARSLAVAVCSLTSAVKGRWFLNGSAGVTVSSCPVRPGLSAHGGGAASSTVTSSMR
ncbi:hypothetical protein [Nonomuraea dietziae]|uniref:hypothetical protein n=1 Tax=Nonomuraea dietziae TaxID=65515 RepID=UPI0031D6F78E